MVIECRHIKSNGKRCHAPALHGEPYCYFHMNFKHLHRRNTPEIPPIEDSSSVLLAVGQIVRGLNYETVDCKRAGLMLYGLQIAAGVTVHIEQAEAAETVADTVRSIHNLEGEPLDFKEAFFTGAPMLAPETSVCEPPHDCATCEQKDSCHKQQQALQSTDTDRWDPNKHYPERAAMEVSRYILTSLARTRKEEDPNPQIEDTNPGELVTLHAGFSGQQLDSGECPVGAPSKLCLGGKRESRSFITGAGAGCPILAGASAARVGNNTADATTGCPMSPSFGIRKCRNHRP